MKRNGRGRSSRERVDAARRQAALALGRDHERRDLFVEPRKSSSTAPPAKPPVGASAVESRAIGVLSIGEAAVRFGVSRTQLEAMIERGLIEALPTGFTLVIPTREVERLQRVRS